MSSAQMTPRLFHFAVECRSLDVKRADRSRRLWFTSFDRRASFSHISARRRHPAQDERIVEAFKKTSRAR
jgi:hypothetical protein